MHDRPVRVLLVEDDEDDYLLTRELTAEIPGGGYSLTWEADFDRAVAAACGGAYDLFLVDYRLGAHSGLDFLRAVRRCGCAAPVVILTGQGEREADLAAMRAGAADFLEKGRLDASLLERSMRYALQQFRHEAELRRGREELERRVEERTAELGRVNDALRSENAERLRSEEALRRSQERLELVVRSTELGLWFCDLPFARLEWNAKCKEHFGLPADAEVTVDTFYARLHGDDRGWVAQAIDRSVRAGDPYDVIFRTVAPDGRLRWVRAIGRAFPASGGRPERFDGVTIEATEQKHAEGRQRFLAEASAAFVGTPDPEQVLRHVADLAVPALADFCFFDLLSADGTLRRAAWAHRDAAAHPALGRLAGMTPPLDAAAHPVALAIRTGQPQFVPELDEAWMRSAATSPEHLRLMTELGGRSLITVPLFAGDRPLGALTLSAGAAYGRRYTAADLHVAEEVARRAALALENGRLYRELREADRRKDEFLAMLSHELRNPLAPLKNALQMVRMAGGRDPDTAREGHEIMERQVTHLVRLVDELLDVERFNRGKVTLRRERTPLAPIVARAVEVSRPALDSRRHLLEVHLPADPVWLEADPLRLAQVFTNLLNNSAKYTPEGGRVSLTVEPGPGAVAVRVCDNGVGIPRDILPRVFDLFTQAERTLDRAEGGLGIGLTLVKGITELHGGTVEVHSEGAGRGSEFVVRLPCPPRAGGPTRPAADDRRPAPAPAPASGPGHRVLVVDDNRDSAATLSRLLQLMGHEVGAAHHGETAVEEAVRFRPTVILLDIGLPGIDGFEVCRRLRRQPETRDAMIVAVTGYTQAEDRRRSQEAGFNEHLVKPVDLDSLQELLRNGAGQREGVPMPPAPIAETRSGLSGGV